MKLNTKRTMLVGLAFLSICIFWQMYDSVMTLILTDTFHLNETIAGAVMAADNVLALFLLPLFGALSDKTNTRIGRRMPYIIGGTAAAVVLMNLLPVLDNAYAASPSPLILGLFIAVLALLLVAMGVYRSPAVALMPDVTPKPLRSRGNAVINLMGAVGGILYLALAAVLYPAPRKVAGHVDYQPLFIIVSLIMAVSVLVLALTVKEKRLSEENRALEKQHPDWNLAAKDESGNEVLPKEVKRSLTFLLASISLWFIAYNGVTTWFTKYIEQVMGEGLGGASTCLLVATAGAICSYIPIGALAAKIGRKRTIQLGVALLTLCFLLGFVLTCTSSVITPVMYVVFALVGLAWAAINVNSLPMVVEMPRQRHRALHRLLLHVFDGCAGRHADCRGFFDARHRLPRAFPLCCNFLRPELRHDVLRPPRRRKGGGKEGAGSIRGHGCGISARNVESLWITIAAAGKTRRLFAWGGFCAPELCP